MPGDAEQRIYRAITRRLPHVYGVGAFANLLKRFYARKRREALETDAHGFRMLLDPNEYLDREVLFTPQLYDRKMLDYLRAHLKPGDTFLDAGANIGVFTLVASRLVAPGKVLSIDADPRTFKILKHNVELNRLDNVLPVNVGLADSRTKLSFAYGQEGLRGVGSFLHDKPGDIEVECLPLYDVMKQHGIERITAAKFDIEGFEFRVLHRFFADAPQEAWPRFFVVERLPDAVEKAGGDVVELLESKGYRVVWTERADHIMVRE